MKDVLKRPTIVEGIFYPENPDALSAMIKSGIASIPSVKNKKPFALIAPYASYLFAKDAFSAAYSQIVGEHYDTVIIISPLHKMAFQGIALTESDYFTSPLGDVEIDKEANKFLNGYNEEFIYYGEKYHLSEHSIETQLPYISTVLSKDTKIVPIIMGEPNTKFTILLSNAIQALIEKGKKEYLIIVTTNLSHNEKYDVANEKDKKFIDILKKMDPDYLAEQLALRQIEAYGGGGVVTLLRIANRLEKDKVNILKQYNSGDISDDKLKVEGFISAYI
ncbi:MAG: AmmeMemoRadiSam system protein B [Spirochaetes bacterium]|nr:AmmeMemoRadiSam system protein B [Spirochaetota bacterium]